MKKLIKKDTKTRALVKFYETNKFIYKNFNNNVNLSKLCRWKLCILSKQLPKKSSPVYVNNRCILTGRKKRINKLYNFSRISFLKLARSQTVNGLIKSSW